MDFFVGISGWYFSWNKEHNMEWFVANSGLNMVELNASFGGSPSATWSNHG